MVSQAAPLRHGSPQKWPESVHHDFLVDAPTFCNNSVCVSTILRSLTNARTTKILASMARGELMTLAAIIAPCSVKA